MLCIRLLDKVNKDGIYLYFNLKIVGKININNVDVMWRIVDVLWKIVEECGCFVEECGCFVEVMWNNVEECGCSVDVMWKIVEECGCFMEQCGCNVNPPHLHISRFDQVLSPPWSVILKYAILDVMWTFHIFTLTVKWISDPFCMLYRSMHL